MNARLLAALCCSAALLTLAACKSPTVLGKECKMVKPSSDGGTPDPVTLADVKDISNQDLIAFGALDCDAEDCIIDAASLETAKRNAENNNGILVGYCSSSCTIGAAGECAPQYNDYQKQAGKAMQCRQLLLDQTTIQSLCTTDEECEHYFGTTKDKVTPYFCSRSSADGGS